MSNDYLWDAAGTPDPGDREGNDVAKLEGMLRQLRRPLPPAPALPIAAGSAGSALSASSASWRFYAPGLALAATLVLMIASTYRNDSAAPAASWEVAQMDGRPRIESSSHSAALEGTGRLAVGQTLATDRDSRARIDVSTIGQVMVEPDTRVRLIATREGRHELALARGTLHAFITAPPGQFIVNTPSSTATDLGCIYTLHVDEDGTGLLSVTVGWVAFEYKGRESFVPAQASARTDPEFGPGTPRYDDATDAFKHALERFDYDRSAAAKSDGLAYVLANVRDKDAMTLWHLIARTGGGDRSSVVTALERIAPMPQGVTRDAVMNLDHRALDLWWDSLGLQDATWWRKWKGPYPATRN